MERKELSMGTSSTAASEDLNRESLQQTLIANENINGNETNNLNHNKSMELHNMRVESQCNADAVRVCKNCPDFAIICAFLEKFHKELGMELPNFKRLQEWLTTSKESKQ